MLSIDGSHAGGQLLRSAVALSVITDTPIRVEDVRGARPEPGLKSQHAAAVRAAALVARAETEGVEPGSETVEFAPDGVTGGRYGIDVGTAGSLTLLFETLLPMALAAEAPVHLRATGGTDVAWSPPFDYLRRVKLPIVRRVGLGATVELERRGFYPKGGGAATLSLYPSTLNPIALASEVGTDDLTGVRVYAAASTDLSEADVSERMARTAAEMLAADEYRIEERVVEYDETVSPGAVVTIRADVPVENGSDVVPTRPTAGVTALGERGVPSEDVAAEALDAFDRFVESAGAVDRHLADQLVLPLAVAGGTVRIPELTDHVASSVDLLSAFGLEVECVDEADGAVLRADGADVDTLSVDVD